MNHHVEDTTAGIRFGFFFNIVNEQDHGTLPVRWTAASVVYLVRREGTTQNCLCSGSVDSGRVLVGTRSGAGNIL